MRKLWVILYILFSVGSIAQTEESDNFFEYKSAYWPTDYEFEAIEPYGGFILSQLLKEKFDFEHNVQYISNFKPYPYTFQTIDTSIYNPDLDLSVISSVENVGACLVDFKYDRGHIYFCSAPMLFSNYYLQKDEGKAFFDMFFNRFKSSMVLLDFWSGKKKILYDSQLNKQDPKKRSGGEKEGSILEHVLGNQSLSWAYTLIMIAGLLLILFKSKRKQRIIPVQQKDENSSKAFIETVSELYLSKNQHRKLALQKRKNFLHFIRNRYFILGRSFDTSFIESLALKSGVNQTVIERIFNKFKVVEESRSLDAVSLSELHNDIELFHKNCN